MPSYTMLNVKMQRDSNATPWGFRMQGGKDFGCPLQIQKINANSLAERCGMEANDYIVKIGQTSTEQLKHPDAQELIKNQNNVLELTLQRGAPPDTNDYNTRVDFPPHQLMQPTQNNFSSQPRIQSPTPQVAMPISNNRAILSQAHNTPIGLYSAENVTDTITRTLKSDVEGLQQKYLSMDLQITNKSDSRQGPAFRALVRGLDETGDPIDQSSSRSNLNQPPPQQQQQQHIDTTTIKGFRYTPNHMNVSPEYKIEEPKNYNEFQASATRSMPKPAPASAPYDYGQQQPRPAPYTTPLPTPQPPPIKPKPNGATVKPSFNVNVQGTPRSGNRVFIRGNKGTAALNQNTNATATATCHTCGINIRGPYISAIGHCYCVNHFTCSNCSTNLIECGFVEENGKLYCEQDFEQFLAPHCAKCSQAILKECVHALEKTWHPECFTCTACKKSIGTGSFHVEEGEPYCIEDYRRMFQAKCTSCDFPIEPGDKYLEAMGGTYHVECFNCSMCQVNLNGQPFVVKNDRPYCRLHGR
ncbi:unnamed protein product [Adineta steineri]|uniref:PDZ and LIM domain protein Zasp n=2 Tax=Adineta steineri TaxID=433720 RepID=A0A813TTY5_9BILA|nr:unnamed protein product [Adineta steineri]CAF3529045.1 unnamed protein product [Adineta steineri]